MTFLPSRRHSHSEVGSPDHAEQDSKKQAELTASRHSSSNPHQNATDSGPGFLRGLFRRKTDSVLNSDSLSSKPRTPNRGPIPQIETNQPVRREQGRESSGQRDRSPSHSGHPTCRTPGSPELPSAVTHSEPKQPGNIQDYLEFRLNEALSLKDDNEADLKKKDIKAILSGAPHFLLERGKHGRWYPQVIFPWDEHNPSILRMLDRKPLPHASFTLCTLHAHLPVPDNWAVRGGVPIELHSWHRTGGLKRASFDIGVFEVPNMLANNGREPGTVGYRHFLEYDIADMVRYSGPSEPRENPEMQRLSQLPASEAFGLMDGYNKPYSQCLSGAVFDRRRLLQEGPTAWKRIGVRDINLRTLVRRLTRLRQLRLKLLVDGSPLTILDFESSHELHTLLHTHFLHPRPPIADLVSGHPESLKSQIKTLTTVLAAPGAWIDFSLPEWRVRAGQVLWEAPPHADGDCYNASSTGTSQNPWMNPGIERKWLLVQLLLAAELLIRLDAFIRMDMLHDSRGGPMTTQELHHFDKLREGKVNWDLIVVRRFLDILEIECGSTPAESSPVGTPTSDKTTAKHRFSFLDSINRRLTSTTELDVRSAWQCHISSPHIRQQLEGLCVFAENIGWPGVDTLKTTLEKKLSDGQTLIFPPINKEVAHAAAEKTFREPAAVRLVKGDMYTRSQSRRFIKLRSPCMEDGDPHASESLGWISRSWLSGFVIPGEGISHLLIGTLLENDADAIQQLGPTANVYGGFVFKDRSYWSKPCIVGRVLSAQDSAQTCMGWVGCDVLPHDADLNPLEPGWFEIQVERVPSSGSCRPRIKQGGKLALESTPLGKGDITPDAFTLPIDQPATSSSEPTVSLEALKLDVKTPQRRNIISGEASISFALGKEGESEMTTISLPLIYNVRFVSAHECRPPLGFLSHRQEPGKTGSTDWSEFKRLPGHPLHRAFTYKNVSLESLPQHPAPTQDKCSETIVIDARGSRTKETFVRAWCASVGSHALIGRVGRTCIACCVREARAIKVPVVVRVGNY
ncbi:hypothetical protein N7520_003007 [Penicillium odoratum]|uniref:uncharacterized protein n=1 Tax=Penicillium odoratum TaxID=1167516 RepID=UPI0025485582|nr:uncharacterized protein N7520_003007 [Penicillium odoratum]KAJ5772478.1 hypothetical protein N7520_003007 [Penicillium odoratum]